MQAAFIKELPSSLVNPASFNVISLLVSSNTQIWLWSFEEILFLAFLYEMAKVKTVVQTEI